MYMTPRLEKKGKPLIRTQISSESTLLHEGSMAVNEIDREDDYSRRLPERKSIGTHFDGRPKSVIDVTWDDSPSKRSAMAARMLSRESAMLFFKSAQQIMTFEGRECQDSSPAQSLKSCGTGGMLLGISV
jgi:hypothetical protein